ncbi:MAG: hypothetical protein ABIO51_06685, partial [Solirubrobacteraceae bacterium]
ALLGARGVSRRAMMVGAVALVLLAASGWLLVQSMRDREHLVAAGPPTFNLVYAPSALRERPVRNGELARLEGQLERVSVEITVRPVEIASATPDAFIGGELPAAAERRLDELRAIHGPIEVFDEGKSRISGLPGYQIGFGARTSSGKRLLGRDAYVFGDEPGAATGVLLSLRRVVRGRQRTREEEFFDKAKEAFVSFAFGESQP